MDSKFIKYKDVFVTAEGKARNEDGTVFELPARTIVRKPLYGVGINDFDYSVQTGGSSNKVIWKPYKTWGEMLRRCFDEKRKQTLPSYVNAGCCKEWEVLSGFLDWYLEQPYVDGSWQLDKDLLIKGNKIYSPDKCVLIPAEVNMFLTRREQDRNLLIGAHFRKASGRYLSSFTKDSRCFHIGSYATEMEAHLAYKKAKEDYAKILAEKYKDVLCIRAYNALMTYQVEVTD